MVWKWKCYRPSSNLDLVHQAKAIEQDSDVAKNSRQWWKKLDRLLDWSFVKSKPIVDNTNSANNDGNGEQQDAAPQKKCGEEPGNKYTVKQIVEAKIDQSDGKLILPFLIIIVILIVLFVLEVVFLPASKVTVCQYFSVLFFALVAVVSSMYEVRVKRVDEVIAEYKESYSKAADVMKRDPWVSINRSIAVMTKYLSILTVFMAALLVVK